MFRGEILGFTRSWAYWYSANFWSVHVIGGTVPVYFGSVLVHANWFSLTRVVWTSIPGTSDQQERCHCTPENGSGNNQYETRFKSICKQSTCTLIAWGLRFHNLFHKRSRGRNKQPGGGVHELWFARYISHIRVRGDCIGTLTSSKMSVWRPMQKGRKC